MMKSQKPDYEDIQEMLGYIDPMGISYDEWREIGMAIKNALGNQGYALRRFRIGFKRNFKRGKSAIVKRAVIFPEAFRSYGLRDLDKKGNEEGKYLKPSAEEGALDIPTGLKNAILEPNKKDPSTGIP